MALFPTSYIRTDGATVTRGRDSLSRSFAGRPQAMTIYCRFVEWQPQPFDSSARLIVLIGDSGTGGIFIRHTASASSYQVVYVNNAITASISATVAVTVVMGDSVELCGQLLADGSLKLLGAVNEGAATETTTATTRSHATQWGDTSPLIEVNGEGSGGGGWVGVRNVVVVRGIHDLDAMRRVARVRG